MCDTTDVRTPQPSAAAQVPAEPSASNTCAAIFISISMYISVLTPSSASAISISGEVTSMPTVAAEQETIPQYRDAGTSLEMTLVERNATHIHAPLLRMKLKIDKESASEIPGLGSTKARVMASIMTATDQVTTEITRLTARLCTTAGLDVATATI